MSGEVDWREEVDNAARLNACVGPHAFVRVSPQSLLETHSLFRCDRCGGEVFASAARLYVRGLREGRAMALRGKKPGA